MATVYRNTRFSSRSVPVRALCSAMALLLLAGCWHVVNVPIWTDDTLVFYPDLVGQYEGEEDGRKVLYQLTAGDNKTYSVVSYSDKGVPAADEMQLRFVKLGDFIFASRLLYKTGTKKLQEHVAVDGLPQFVSRVTIRGKDITCWTLPAPAGKPPTENHSTLLDHPDIRTKEVVSFNAQTGKNEKTRTLDMTTSEMQSFLAKHGAEFTQEEATYKWLGPVR